MSETSVKPIILTILRWIARIWSILIFIVVLLVIIIPDPNVVKPVPLTDWVELGFYGLATLGLLLAWRWEGLGGGVTILGILGHTIVFRIFRGVWFVQVLPIIIFGVPAILFLVYQAFSPARRT